MKTIGVTNYRSILDSGNIELKPLTVIVGRNSCGKSSFIRLFPLLKQTIERPIAESLLWYGDYVDLGDYESAINNSRKNEKIELSFSGQVKLDSIRRYHAQDMRPLEYKVKVRIDKSHIEKMWIEYEDQSIILYLSNDKNVWQTTINGRDYTGNIFGDKKIQWSRRSGSFLPYINTSSDSMFELEYGIPYYANFDNPALSYLCKTLGATNTTRFGKITNQFSTNRRAIWEFLGMPQSKKECLAGLKEYNKNRFANYKIEQSQFEEINNLLVLANLNLLITDINSQLRSEMAELNYMKPIRAMIDRYYRVQGISVNTIDVDGSNLPMILHNMDKNKLKKFEKWSLERFGIIFSITHSAGHVSLVIKSSLDAKDDETINLADTGYGYSQMLPIVVLLWMIHDSDIKKGRVDRVEKLVVIEQPELHLHPGYQAKMMDIFVNIINEAKKIGLSLKIIFETHSEAMINRLGALVEYERIDMNDINVLVFNKKDKITTVSSRKFDKYGILSGWPDDFFAPEDLF